MLARAAGTIAFMLGAVIKNIQPVSVVEVTNHHYVLLKNKKLLQI